jgi:hypothetical protein
MAYNGLSWRKWRCQYVGWQSGVCLKAAKAVWLAARLAAWHRENASMA